MTERKHFAFNATITFSVFLFLALLVSCSGDDDSVEVPITSHKELEQALNSATATDITCVTAKITVKKLSYEDYSRYYPGRKIEMWLGWSTEEDYHPDVLVLY